jgi:Fe-S oxidoreductase
LGQLKKFDDRAKKITKTFVRILNRTNVSLLYLEQKKVVLETLQRAGNEFCFQMQAMMNIEVLNGYEAKKICYRLSLF